MDVVEMVFSKYMDKDKVFDNLLFAKDLQDYVNKTTSKEYVESIQLAFGCGHILVLFKHNLSDLELYKVVKCLDENNLRPNAVDFRYNENVIELEYYNVGYRKIKYEANCF